MSRPAAGHCDIARPCPECGQTKLELHWWLEAKPIGSFSLAGAQMKFSAVENAVVRCLNCEFALIGHITADARVEDGRFVSGHFEAMWIRDRVVVGLAEDKPGPEVANS